MRSSMDKVVLTLYEILDGYYYKEWIQEELREVGLPSSGDKEELIDRFLNSAAAQRSSVCELGKHLVEALRLQELRQLAEHVGIATQGRREQVLKGILDSVAFEPFIKRTKKHCEVCSRDRMHELHFGDDWKADDFICEVCRSEVPAKVSVAKNDSVHEPVIPQVLHTTNVQVNETSHGASAFAIALTVASTFIAVVFSIGPAYNWLLGIFLGFVITIAEGFLLIWTRSIWAPQLLKWIR